MPSCSSRTQVSVLIFGRLPLTASALCRQCRILRAWTLRSFLSGMDSRICPPPTKEPMELALEQRIDHSRHPVLRQMMEIIFIRTDPAGNINRTKRNPQRKSTVLLITPFRLLHNRGLHNPPEGSHLGQTYEVSPHLPVNRRSCNPRTLLPPLRNRRVHPLPPRYHRDIS